MASGGMKFPSHTPHTFAHRHHAVSFNIHTTSNAFVKQPRGSSLAFGLRAQRREDRGCSRWTKNFIDANWYYNTLPTQMVIS